MKKKNNIQIHISDNALLHLLMSGLECFNLRFWRGKITQKRGPTETAGTLWGYFIGGDGTEDDHVRVEFVSQDVLADRHKSWVVLQKDTTWVKSQLVQARWPHLSLIGDFHTHPYETYSECNEACGWKFSDGDCDYFQHTWNNQKELELWKRCKVSLLLTIAHLDRVHDEKRWDPDVVENHIVRFQIDRFRFWITAYAIDLTDQSSFVVSPGNRQCRKQVYIDIPTINGTTNWFVYNDLVRISRADWN
ncbi:MAG: hypothetical protein F4039_10785 [Gammaproteobacteria bacterium]|nr:hypothetical protein [Gammaproteobacteria bacterium]MYF52759.1 hypothetical protein [Gammaproteobacteria bacterium]MYK44551.1 hypothetical protein [Gammaproteobacteria bacterium]